MSILIKNVLLNEEETDIYIEGNLIEKIEKNINYKADNFIDGKNKAIIPSFVNSHTHAAMTLLRGYADDMQVKEWLEKKIWPLEAKLSEEDIYWGAKFACLEMIKSGTTLFNDMYWHFHGTAKAVEEMGIRAIISSVIIDFFDEKKLKEQIEINKRLFEEAKQYSKRITFALGPHSIYSNSEEALRWAKKFADENKLLIHIHLSESKNEVEECIKKYKMRPAEFLESIKFLGPNVIAAHSIWLDEKEIKILRKNDVKIAYNPTSNMKLSSGILPYEKLKSAGLTLTLGTDGCASNNNLDMLEEMKFASLLQKINTGNPTSALAKDIFNMATINGAEALRINCGKIEERRLADFLLIDLKNIYLNPQSNLISNLVYSANSECIDSTICDGKILMQNRKVKGEEDIVKKINEIYKKLI